MDEILLDFYKLGNIDQYEDIHLLTLSEQCAVLEERVYAIAMSLPSPARQVIEDYISTRNDLGVETLKTALRWGKKHYK